MSKRSDLSLAAAELKRCGDTLIGIAEALANLRCVTDDTEAVGQPVAPGPEAKPISLATVRAVLAEKSCNGYTSEVRALLEKHGAAKLSEINPAEYPALLAEAEVLGNG